MDYKIPVPTPTSILSMGSLWDVVPLFRYFGLLVLLVWVTLHVFVGRLYPLWRSIRLIDQIPGPTSFSTLLGLTQALRGYTFVYGKERIYRLWVGWEPWVVLWVPETVEAILANNFILEKASQYEFLHPWLGTGLLTSTGTKWRSRRKMLVPAFHFKILSDFVPVFNEQSHVLVGKLRERAHRGDSFDIIPIITACTLDAICETVMGVSIGAQDDPTNRYCKAVNEVGECWLERLIQPCYWLDWVYNASGPGKHFKTNVSLLHTFTRNVIRERKKELMGGGGGGGGDGGGGMAMNFKKLNKNRTKGGEGKGEGVRKAFLDLLLDHHLNGGDLSEEDIREEVDTFMFEGHDTTAMALSWIIHYLGHNLDVQEKVWPEIDSLFRDIESAHQDEDQGDGQEEGNYCPQISLEQLKELKYLECIIKEGLRLSPSVPFVGRRVHEDLKVATRDGKTYTLPRGSIAYVFIYMLHRDPEIWPYPETFNPDRFLPENSTGRHPFAFVPFSAGPRNCIGQRFALSELKIIMAFLLRDYCIVSLDPLDKIVFNMEMVLRPKVALNVKLIPRSPPRGGGVGGEEDDESNMI